MATLPYFILSPNTILSALGFVHGPDPVVPTPAEDWRAARVAVVIPALNEAKTIVLCLASLMRQTLRPHRITLVDDGSRDATVRVAEAFARMHALDLTIVRRDTSTGKTPGLKQQARTESSDVLFVLDADTELESPTYLARTVEELYSAPGVASVCGLVLPQGRAHRRRAIEQPAVQRFVAAHPHHRFTEDRGWHVLSRGATNMYRDVLYSYLQRFVYRGENLVFGTIANPVGCAVAYRRAYLEKLFEEFEPKFGDDLTNSEDIFIGLAMIDAGYRNVQLTDVVARTVEPELQRLPRQVYLWSSAFLQSCFYFDALLTSPFRTLRRRKGQGHGGGLRAGTRPLRPAAMPQNVALAAALPAPSPLGSFPLPRLTAFLRGSEPQPAPPAFAGGPAAADGERRRVAEPYRQPFGREWTRRLGRPAGWMLMTAAIEKVFFPSVLLILALLGNWSGVAWTAVLETAIGATVLALVMSGQRLQYAAKAVAVAPIRYALLVSELVTLGRFASDIWVRKDRRWRK